MDTPTVSIGIFRSTIVSNKCNDVFYVMKGYCDCLLSVKASQTLGFISVADHVVHNVGSTECHEVKKYFKVLYGNGKLKQFKVNLHIKAIPRRARCDASAVS